MAFSQKTFNSIKRNLPVFALLLLSVLLFFGCTQSQQQPQGLQSKTALELVNSKADGFYYIDFQRLQSDESASRLANRFSEMDISKSIAPIQLAAGIDERRIISVVATFKKPSDYHGIIIDGNYSVNMGLVQALSNSNETYLGQIIYYFGNDTTGIYALAVLGKNTVAAGSRDAVFDIIEAYNGSSQFMDTATLQSYSRLPKDAFLKIGTKPKISQLVAGTPKPPGFLGVGVGTKGTTVKMASVLAFDSPPDPYLVSLLAKNQLDGANALLESIGYSPLLQNTQISADGNTLYIESSGNLANNVK